MNLLQRWLTVSNGHITTESQTKFIAICGYQFDLQEIDSQHFSFTYSMTKLKPQKVTSLLWDSLSSPVKRRDYGAWFVMFLTTLTIYIANKTTFSSGQYYRLNHHNVAPMSGLLNRPQLFLVSKAILPELSSKFASESHFHLVMPQLKTWRIWN